jgi:hypothetical protein
MIRGAEAENQARPDAALRPAVDASPSTAAIAWQVDRTSVHRARFIAVATGLFAP